MIHPEPRTESLSVYISPTLLMFEDVWSHMLFGHLRKKRNVE